MNQIEWERELETKGLRQKHHFTEIWIFNKKGWKAVKSNYLHQAVSRMMRVLITDMSEIAICHFVLALLNVNDESIGPHSNSGALSKPTIFKHCPRKDINPPHFFYFKHPFRLLETGFVCAVAHSNRSQQIIHNAFRYYLGFSITLEGRRSNLSSASKAEQVEAISRHWMTAYGWRASIHGEGTQLTLDTISTTLSPSHQPAVDNTGVFIPHITMR